MAKLRKLNNIRRKFMERITRNVGGDHEYEIDTPINKEEIKRILINRPNHRLGNQLMVLPLVEEIATTLPHCKVDLFVKGGLSPILFENYPNVDRIIKLPKKHFKQIFQYIGGWAALKKKKYDLVINIDKASSSGRLSTKTARGRFKFFGSELQEEIKSHPDNKHLAKYPVYAFRHILTKLGIKTQKGAVPVMDLKLSGAELEAAKLKVNKLIDPSKKTICLFTYATGKKRFSEEWWLTLYEELQQNFPDCNIIEMLPVENVSQIQFKAPSFYSKDIREICAFIANIDVFLGADSGMMHLASASKTPTLGLFSCTVVEKYEPYGNNSKAIDTRIHKENDYIITELKKILQY